MNVTVTLEEVRTAPHGRVVIELEIDHQPDSLEAARAAAAVWDAIARSAVFTVNGKHYDAVTTTGTE